MAYIEVDIDLDEFDTDDIVREVISRIEDNHKGRKGFSDLDKAELLEALGIPIKSADTLLDRLKMEVLAEAAEKYTLHELEELLRAVPKTQPAADPNQCVIPIE